MGTYLPTGMSLLLAGLLAATGAAQAQQANDLAAASATSNVPPRAGEASTMTNGVPNLVTSNVQPGELGIQTRLTVRRYARAPGGDPALKVMGASGALAPVRGAAGAASAD
jgi:hypothetical protein